MATAATGGDRPQTQIQPCSYKVGKTLGAGSYSVVKECIHIDTGRYYAAKMINKKLMAGKEHMVYTYLFSLGMCRHLTTGVPDKERDCYVQKDLGGPPPEHPHAGRHV
jgi:serine/threonine protein kinase